ncbi:MAG: ACP S-malonyltransferase [Butyricicoccaceae bacterium]
MEYGFAFFPGQGAQAPGMGKDLYENSQAARLVFEEASDGAGIDVAKLCFDSDKETLSRTENSQIAIFTHSMAASAALREAGVHVQGGGRLFARRVHFARSGRRCYARGRR